MNKKQLEQRAIEGMEQIHAKQLKQPGLLPKPKGPEPTNMDEIHAQQLKYNILLFPGNQNYNNSNRLYR